ncbi:hypothetical protein KNE206_57410 [Kitasatospora sp. NE20-6]
MDFSPRRRSIWDMPDDSTTAHQPPVPDSVGKPVPLHKLWANPFNPRLVHDDAEIDAMADSIRAEGLLQDLMIADVGPFLAYWTSRLGSSPVQRTLLTKSLAKARPDDFVILIGHNRHTACARAGLDHAPCRIRNDKIDRARVLALPENLRRIKLNPVEEALGFRGAVEDGLTQAEIAAQVGCQQPHISRRLKLLHLVDELRDAVMDGTLRTADAELIAGTLPNADNRQVDVLGRMRAQGVSAHAALARLDTAPSQDHGAESDPGTAAPILPTPESHAHAIPDSEPLLPGQATPADGDSVHAAPATGPNGVAADEAATTTHGENDGAQARAGACQLLLQGAATPNPREALRLIAPAVLLADPAARRLAWTWLNPYQAARNAPRQPFADLPHHPNPKPTYQAALATALAALERRTRHTPRPWQTADRTYIEHLVRHAGYHPTPWEQARLRDTKAPAADIPSE